MLLRLCLLAAVFALACGVGQIARAHDRVPPGHCCPICGKICGCPLTVSCGEGVNRDDSCIKTTMADVIRDSPRGRPSEGRLRRPAQPATQAFESADTVKARGRDVKNLPEDAAASEDLNDKTSLPSPPTTVDFGAPQSERPPAGMRPSNPQLVLPQLGSDPNSREARPLLFR